MSAGTLTLTNNSAAVSGAGTAFNTELAAGDFIVVTVGGVPYTLPVKSVESATTLTLVSVYTGPTQGGAAWSAVPRVALNMVTAALVAQSAEALRGLNYDKQNWQQVFSGAGTITVKLPDGSTYTGPSWKYLSENMATKVGGAVPLDQGGTGAKDATGARTNLGISDKQLNSVDGKSGGTLTGQLWAQGNMAIITNTSGFGVFSFYHPGTLAKAMSYMFTENYGDIVFVTTAATVSGTEKYFTMRQNGNMTTPGNITCVSVTQTSDAEKKDNIEAIDGALSKIERIRGVTYQMKDSGMPSAGVIAQELIEVLPDAVGTVFDDYDRYEDVTEHDDHGEEVTVKKLVHKRDDSKRSYTVEYSGVIALCVEAIKELNETVKLQQQRIDELSGTK